MNDSGILCTQGLWSTEASASMFVLSRENSHQSWAKRYLPNSSLCKIPYTLDPSPRTSPTKLTDLRVHDGGRAASWCGTAAGLGWPLKPKLPGPTCVPSTQPAPRGSPGLCRVYGTQRAGRRLADSDSYTQGSIHQQSVWGPVGVSQDLRQRRLEARLSLESCSALPKINAHGELSRLQWL